MAARRTDGAIRIDQATAALPGSVAAIYVRQSRTHDGKKDHQKAEQHVETTLDTQAAACKREALARGYSVRADSVFGERYTGAEMWDRPILSDLRRRIKARDFQALFVYSTDRLARDPIHLALILEECERYGCELVFVTEPIERSPEGQLILYIKGYAAKIERLRIKDRMARGRNAIIAAGKLTGQGFALYGYTFDPANRVRVINESTASTVRDIFRWVAHENMSLRAVRDRLVSMRIPCPAEVIGLRRAEKSVWSTSQIARMIHNEAYLGITQVNRTRATEVRIKKTGKYKSANVPKKDWKVLPDEVTPAIIDEPTFRLAATKLESNRKRSDYTRNSLRPVLLRGLLHCGECGSIMYPMSETTHKVSQPNRAVYRCSDKRRRDNRADKRRVVCSATRLIAADVENRAWDKLVTFLIEPALVEREVKRVLSASPDDSLVSDLSGAQKQLAAAKRLRDAALDKYEDAIADDDRDLADRWDKKAKSANSDMRALASVVERLEAKLAAYSNSGKTAKAFAKQVKSIMSLRPEDYTFDEKRAALEALAVKVYACRCHPMKIELNTGILTDQVEHPVAVEVRA